MSHSEASRITMRSATPPSDDLTIERERYERVDHVAVTAAGQPIGSQRNRRSRKLADRAALSHVRAVAKGGSMCGPVVRPHADSRDASSLLVSVALLDRADDHRHRRGTARSDGAAGPTSGIGVVRIAPALAPESKRARSPAQLDRAFARRSRPASGPSGLPSSACYRASRRCRLASSSFRFADSFSCLASSSSSLAGSPLCHRPSLRLPVSCELYSMPVPPHIQGLADAL